MSTISTMMKAAGGFTALAIATAAVNRVADKVAATTLDKTINTIQAMTDTAGPKSYVRASAAVRVEPFVMLDAEFVELPNAKDVVNLAQRFITCYYLLSHSADNSIAGVTIGQRMSKFSPDRSLLDASKTFMNNRGVYSTESYQFGLPSEHSVPSFERYEKLMSKNEILSLEHRYAEELISRQNELGAPGTNKNGDPLPQQRIKTSGMNVDKVVSESVNLAIGQIVNVEINHGGEKIVTPVQIRLRPMVVPPEAISATFALRGKSYSLPARLQQQRVGEIGWKDLVFQTDRVREYREIAIKDKSGFFRQTHARANKNFLATMLSGKASVGEMSSAIITTTNTVKDFERKTGLLLSDFKTRQRILEDTMAMVILVVDPDYATVAVYLDTIDDKNAVYNLSDIKMGGKNDGNDLTQLMTSLLEGRLPGRL